MNDDKAAREAPGSSQQRIVMFLSAMRHFAAALREDGVPLHYGTLREGGLADALR